jgi:LysM repeat protein
MIKILRKKNSHISMKMNNNIKIIFTVLLFNFSQFILAQETHNHKIAKGETIISISQKYSITPNDIYKLNPDVLNGIQENGTLIIPIKTNTQDIIIENQNQNIHIVKKGETLFKLAKKHKTTIELLEKLNPELKNGLKLEQKLIIPHKNQTKKIDEVKIKTNKVENNNDFHIVQAKETLYSISKKYNISQEVLTTLNPEIINGLPVGFNLKLTKNSKVIATDIKNTTNNKEIINHKVLEGETLYGISKKYNINTSDIILLNPSVENGINIDDVLNIPINSNSKINENLKENKNSNPSKPIETKPIETKPIDTNVKEVIAENLKTHKVVAGETIYSISNKYNISQEILLALNPNIKNGLQIDTILNLSGDIPNTSIAIPKEESKPNVLKTTKILNNSLSKFQKDIVLLIPFNTDNQDFKIEEFTKKLQKDAFLNLALDFYSGAMIAIDSLKKLNINVKFNIIDSNETKNSSNIATYSNLIKISDIVIGPFYQNNAEETAKLFPLVPIISPLSKEISNPIKNLYQSMPSADFIKLKTLDYLTSKNTQIVALIDKNKNNTRTLISSIYKKILLTPINEKGSFETDPLINHLNKDKLNYIVIETSSTSFLLNVLNTVNTIKTKGYKLQLVILDFNKIYESEEIFPKIYKQDFFYPSISKPNETSSGKRFNKIYKQKHNSNASVYAIRGFDVVFDTAIRIAQEESFEEQAQHSITNHLEYKFNYQKNPLGEGYVNNGIYFLKYSKDMKIVEMEE